MLELPKFYSGFRIRGKCYSEPFYSKLRSGFWKITGFKTRKLGLHGRSGSNSEWEAEDWNGSFDGIFELDGFFWNTLIPRFALSAKFDGSKPEMKGSKCDYTTTPRLI